MDITRVQSVWEARPMWSVLCNSKGLRENKSWEGAMYVQGRMRSVLQRAQDTQVPILGMDVHWAIWLRSILNHFKWVGSTSQWFEEEVTVDWLVYQVLPHVKKMVITILVVCCYGSYFLTNLWIRFNESSLFLSNSLTATNWPINSL